MNASNSNDLILADGRWLGTNGIGRFSREVLSRLLNTDILKCGPKPLSLKNLWWQTRLLQKQRHRYKVFYTPGFNPVNYSPIPTVVTIADLIHLYAPGNNSLIKKAYYELFIKNSVRKAYKIITTSEYSKISLMAWANIPAEKIVNVSCGISQQLTDQGIRYNPGYPYLLHVGNTKKHKNVARLLHAFAKAKTDSSLKLILTGDLTQELATIIAKHQLKNRIIFDSALTELKLAEYYRGATAVVFPSLYEGFGLPVLEAMACGTSVLTANVTSLPEVAGDAAVLVDPYDIDSMTQGIEKIVTDETLRKNLIAKGLQRVNMFSWDKTAEKIQCVLNETLAL